jgi:serine/threonine protein kinase
MDEQSEAKLRSLHLNQTSDRGTAFAQSGDPRVSLPPGHVVEQRFRIIGELGRGGTGTVYQVEQLLLKQQFAMKILDPLQVNDEAWRRFQKEAQAAGRLDHAGFVKVYEFGLIGNSVPFFTMDLVVGDTLSARLRQQGPMSVTEALPIFIQLCFALDYAHTKGVVHRDIKPSNIATTKSDTTNGDLVKILDFGIAKLMGLDTTSLTQVGAVFGTPFYMSPEQCMGQAVDQRSDIYSLGCTFFEVLTGAPPFTTEHALALMMQHQSETPPSLKEASMGAQFPEALELIIRKMLAKNPDDRYQRLLDAANDLVDLQQGKSSFSSSKKLLAATTAGSDRKTNASLLITVLVALTVLVLASGYFMISSSQKPKVSVPEKNATSSEPTQSKQLTQPEKPTQPATGEKSLDTSSDAEVTSQRYFSTDTTLDGLPGGVPARRFKFLSRPLIGYITASDMTGHQQKKLAIGDIVVPFVPKKSRIDMLIDWRMCSSSPQLLGKFRPDEIGFLKLQDENYRRDTAGDDIFDGFDNALGFIDNLQSIYALDLPSPVTNKSIPHIAKLKNLRYLGISNTKITGDALADGLKIGNQKNLLLNLEMLNAEKIKNASVILPILKHSTRLTGLNLSGGNLQDSDLKNLSDVTTLEKLVIRANPKVTDRGLKYLSKLHLSKLVVVGCDITPKSTETLSKMKVYDSVTVDSHKWSESDIARLQKMVPYSVKSWNQHDRQLKPSDATDSNPEETTESVKHE